MHALSLSLSSIMWTCEYVSFVHLNYSGGRERQGENVDGVQNCYGFELQTRLKTFSERLNFPKKN